MIRKQLLFVALTLCTFFTSFGQILTFDFNGLTGNEVSATSNFNDANLSSSTITRGSGLTAATNGGRFNATNWALTNISNAVSGNNYMEFTISQNAGYQFDVNTIDVNIQRSSTGLRGIALRSSIDGYAANIDIEKVIIDNTSVQSFTFTVNQLNNSSAVTYRFYGWAEAIGGAGGFEGTGNDIVVNGAVSLVSATPTITVSPASLTGLDYVVGTGPSVEQMFTVSGSNLTADIILTPPANFEISLATGVLFSPTDPITLAQSGGTVGATTIYVRLKAGLVVNPFTGNITAISNTTTQNVAVSGNVTPVVGGSCSELFISEYIEGSGNNKFIEIYNPTASIITLTGVYDIQIYANGSATASSTIALTGSIAAYGVFVLENTSEALGVTADQQSISLTYNGNDAIVLRKSGANIDVIGQIGVDPGTQWSGTCSTLDRTLIRKSTIQAGDTNGSDSFNPDTEWSCAAIDDVSNLGSHISDCDSTCTPTHTITSFAPTSGPVGTQVTISGTGFTTGSTVSFNGTNAVILSQTATVLVVEVPSGAATGLITVTEVGCGLDSSSVFTVVLNTGSCTSSFTFSDIFISEVTDASAGSLTYVEIYNGTGGTIDLTNYDIRITNNGTLNTDIALTGTLVDGGSFIFATEVGSPSCAVPGGDGTLADQNDVHSGINNNDCISLLKFGTPIDIWGVCDGSLWIDALGLGTEGYDFQRKAIASAPSITFNAIDWTIVDFDTCSDSYTDIESYAGSSNSPVISLQPNDATSCSSASFTVAATAGSGGTLTYQWKYNDGSALGWTDIISSSFAPGTVSGATGTTLTISGANVDGYQFYCVVTEGLCSVASKAAQASSQATTWNGTTWSTPPTLATAVILNGNYNTSPLNVSFRACTLTVNAGFTLTVNNGYFVEVENDVTVNGTITVATQGSFVQNNNAGTFTVNSGGAASVNKSTSNINTWYEYTYWSSPVIGETIGNALPSSKAARRYWYNAINYQDSTMETGNNNATVLGQDDIDDNGDDWQYSNNADVMSPGVGYVATLSSSFFTAPGQYPFSFNGPFNTGIISVPVVKNAEPLDNDWNLIGNPYPSAIDASLFITQNKYNSSTNPSGVLEGAIYLWSQNTPDSNSANGNETSNYAQSDYAVINGASAIAGGDGITPNLFIPSGQSFFVAFSKLQPSSTGNVIFNNAMRKADLTSNSQFFKGSPVDTKNTLWLNLTSDNGLFNQIAIAYLEGATNEDDGMFYDAPKNLSTGAAAILYSIIETAPTLKFAIQGKDKNSLTVDEIIPIGLYTTIAAPFYYKLSIAKQQGDFFNKNTIYLKDNVLNTYHNLASGPYTFTSEVGEYNNRFQIVFKNNDVVLVENENFPKGVSVVELNDGNVHFTVGDNLQIKTVEILDLLGRVLYKFKGTSNSEIYNISKLNKAIYIAKIELSNNEIIIKKAIKRY